MFSTIGTWWDSWKKKRAQDKADKRYANLLQQKMSRTRWQRLWSSDYTEEQINDLYHFAVHGRDEHLQYWEEFHQCKVTTDDDKRAAEAHRYAMVFAAKSLIRIQAEGRAITRKTYESVMDVVYLTAYYTLRDKLNKDPMPGSGGYSDVPPSVVFAF